MQRRAADLALADRQGDDGDRFPASLAVDAVVALGGRHGAGLFARDVGFEPAAETETLGVGLPAFEALLHGAVFRIVEDGAEHVAVVRVARHHDRLVEVDGAGMAVAAHAEAAHHVAAVAAVHRVRRQDALLQADQAVDQLEHRAGRLGAHHGAVVHRLVGVVHQFLVVLVDLRQLAHVDAGAGDHRQDVAGAGLDGHERTDLVLHQALAVGLQRAVDRGGHVDAGDGFLVVLAVHIVLLDAVVGVAQVDVIALLAA